MPAACRRLLPGTRKSRQQSFTSALTCASTCFHAPSGYPTTARWRQAGRAAGVQSQPGMVLAATSFSATLLWRRRMDPLWCRAAWLKQRRRRSLRVALAVWRRAVRRGRHDFYALPSVLCMPATPLSLSHLIHAWYLANEPHPPAVGRLLPAVHAATQRQILLLPGCCLTLGLLLSLWRAAGAKLSGERDRRFRLPPDLIMVADVLLPAACGTRNSSFSFLLYPLSSCSAGGYAPSATFVYNAPSAVLGC